MDFFGMGMGEILLILVVALIVWGPGKIPELARTLGKMTRAFRKASSDLTTAVTRELDMADADRTHQPKADDEKTKKPPTAGKAESDTSETASQGDQ